MLQDDSLRIAFALAFGLDTVVTDRFLFAAFDAAFATRLWVSGWSAKKETLVREEVYT